MPSVVLRVRTRAKQLRLQVEDSKTIAEVKALIAKDSDGIVPKSITVDPAETSAPLPDSSTIAALGFANGQMVYAHLPAPPASPGPAAGGAASRAAAAAGPAAAEAAAPSSPAPRQLTSRCTHGPRGVCMHCCAPTEADYEKIKAEPLNKAARFAPRHVEHSVAAGEELTGEMEWLCRHRPDQMCVNCAPLQPGEKVEHLEMLCQHGPGARCVNCLPPDSTVDKRKFLSFQEWLDKRKARCEHSFAATCVNCAPPTFPMYKLKPGCAKHRPWPAGICLDCAPPSVDLALQPYRHIDFVSFNCTEELQRFMRPWYNNKAVNLQRVGHMYGTTAPDSNYPSGRRVVVEAIYEPPQVCDGATGVVKVLPDPRAAHLEAVARAAGLKWVGWLFTRSGKSEAAAKIAAAAGGGKAGMDQAVQRTALPHELFAMAAQQLRHLKAAEGAAAAPSGSAASGGSGAASSSSSSSASGTLSSMSSDFVSVLLTEQSNGSVEPQGFQASDQLVALVRDGVLLPPGPADTVFKVRPAVPGEPPVPEVINKSMQRGAHRVTEFDPTFCTVTLESGAGGAGAGGAGSSGPLFKHFSFPPENREAMGESQSPRALKQHLNAFKSEPYWSRLSDFHLLVYLAQILDVETAVAAAQAVARREPVAEGVQLLLDSILAAV